MVKDCAVSPEGSHACHEQVLLSVNICPALTCSLVRCAAPCVETLKERPPHPSGDDGLHLPGTPTRLRCCMQAQRPDAPCARMHLWITVTVVQGAPCGGAPSAHAHTAPSQPGHGWRCRAAALALQPQPHGASAACAAGRPPGRQRQPPCGIGATSALRPPQGAAAGRAPAPPPARRQRRLTSQHAAISE